MPVLMKKNEIMEIIPQTPPFLLVDEVNGLMPGQEIKAIRNVEHNDIATSGNGGIVPAGISLEMFYQAISICILSMPENKGKILVLEEVRKFLVRDDIEAGNIVDIEVSISRIRRDIVTAKAAALVEGDRKMTAEFILKIEDGITLDVKEEKSDVEKKEDAIEEVKIDE